MYCKLRKTQGIEIAIFNISNKESKKMTIIDYISTVTTSFNDKRIIKKTENLLKKNCRAEDNKIMDAK